MKLATSITLALLAALPSSRAPRIACPAPDAAAFAWWPGTWNYSVPHFDPGVTTVTSASGGCVLREEFVDIHANKAHTTIEYDAAAKRWKRTVTDPFRTYHSTGTFTADGTIAFYETATDRESYRPIDHTHVLFSGEKSTDGGKTWTLLFDATYTRRP